MQGADLSVRGDGPVGVTQSEAAAREMMNVVSQRLPSFYGIAYRLLGNTEDAEDAVQDALLSAHKNLKQFRGDAKMSTWLTAIVCNSARMHLRRRLRPPHVSLDSPMRDEQESLSQRLVHHGLSPEHVYRNSETNRQLRQCATQLSPALRRTFWLRDIEELSVRETSRILGLSTGTIKAQLSRARVKLKRIMKRTRRAHHLVMPGGMTVRSRPR